MLRTEHDPADGRPGLQLDGHRHLHARLREAHHALLVERSFKCTCVRSYLALAYARDYAHDTHVQFDGNPVNYL